LEPVKWGRGGKRGALNVFDPDPEKKKGAGWFDERALKGGGAPGVLSPLKKRKKGKKKRGG